MATGDNMLTAISVGRKCGIVKDHQAVYLGDYAGEGQMIKWTIAKNLEDVQDDKNKHHHLEEQALVTINEDEAQIFPWEKNREKDFAIAVTGKVFNFLLNDPSMKSVLQEVVLRGQIYARMTPDDKAKLVNQLQNFLR